MQPLYALSTLKAAEEGREVELLHPGNGTPLGIFVTICGADSKTCKEIIQRQTNRRLELAAKNRGRKKAATSAEQMEAEALELLSGCTRSWRTEIRDEKGALVENRPQVEISQGEWLECTPENARRLYVDFPWSAEQIDGEIGDRSAFLQN